MTAVTSTPKGNHCLSFVHYFTCEAHVSPLIRSGIPRMYPAWLDRNYIDSGILQYRVLMPSENQHEGGQVKLRQITALNVPQIHFKK